MIICSSIQITLISRVADRDTNKKNGMIIQVSDDSSLSTTKHTNAVKVSAPSSRAV